MIDGSDSNSGGLGVVKQDRPRSLKEALYVVRNRQADRDDVVVDMKAAEESRLELLADELRPLVSEIDPADERFEFSLTRGERPRLWSSEQGLSDADQPVAAVLGRPQHKIVILNVILWKN